ncbi:LuxR C-terminal-related transcriptional regulator [uncultured Brevundimonas sp.]|uniref:helix-turn-helix transcriptional regulator n=1 Tax=uncultured Brevundimonas sp. TaxID=213418 RepID=UPI0026371EE9|nr:LuxR C-terminal-related transcriptional regulator [uncultured Brevundimonas sp.]
MDDGERAHPSVTGARPPAGGPRPRQRVSTAASVEDRLAPLVSGCLARPRLFAAGHETTRCRLLRAPPGYGKSVAMAQRWLDHRRGRGPAAWVSIRDCRGDLRTVAERLGAQLSPCAAAGQAAPPVRVRDRPSSLDELADRLWETRDPSGPGVLICFDDIEFDPRSMDPIEDFMLAAPAETRFVAATAADAGFARMKARHEIQELRAGALAFTLDEAKAIANAGPAARLTESEADALWRRTQGWPAIFQLLVQAAADSRSASDRLVIDRITGRDSDLCKYFSGDFLKSLDGDLLEFCIDASILGDVSAEYFNYVFDRTDAAACIEKLSVGRMLLQPVDRTQSAYRFHPLLREFLEHRFSIQHGDAISKLLARAAGWQRQNRNSRESISMSLRAGETDSAAEVASENMMDIALRQGEIDQIQSWQGSFSAAVVAGTPTIALGLAWAQIFSHDHKRATGLLADLRAVDLAAFDRHTARQMECWRDLIAAIGEATSDDFIESRRQCEAWLESYRDADLVCKGAILTCLCFIATSEHRFDDQRALWIEASSVNNISHHRYALGWLHSATIFAALSRGDMYAAADLLAQARDDDNARIDSTPFSASLLNTLEFELGYETGRPDGIETRVDEILDFARRHGVVDFTFSAYRTAAAIARRNGDLNAAMALLQDMRATAAEFGFARLDALARLELADLLAAANPEGATALLPGRNDPVFLSSHGPYLRARRSLTEARIAVRQERFHLAGRLANAALGHARRSGLGRLEISALLCGAAAYAATEREVVAGQRATDAVQIASRLGCRRTLLDERRALEALGPIAAPLLDLIPDEGELGRAETRPGDRRPRLPGGPDLVVLTRKELTILQKIREGCSNREISLTHRISEDTVKWHVRNIFMKLNVKNRVQAILKAEQTGVLY